MASRTQLRLGQITGSLGNFEGGIIDTRSASAAGSIDAITLNSGSLAGVFSEVASSILRIHGADTFASNAISVLKDINGDTRISYVDGADTILNNDDASITLTVGSNIEAAGTFVPDSDAGQDLGTSSLHWGTLHVGQVDATGLTGSIAGTGITNDQVVVSNNGTLEGDANFTFDGSTLTLGGGAGLSVDGSATIAGNLTVNGSTTTVSSSNTILADRVLAIASGSTNADVDSGLVFRRATADLGGGSDKQNGAILFDGGTGNVFKLGVTNDDASTDTLTVADDDLADLYAGKLFLDGASNSLDVVSSNLTAVAAGDFVVDAATDIILDADSGNIFIDDNTSRIGKLVNVSAQNTFALSSSAGNDLGLDANTGNILFTKDGAGGSSPSTAALNVATSNEINFGHYDAPNTAFNVGFLTLKDNAVSVLSASSGLQIDAGADVAQLQLVDATTNVLTIDVPAAVTSYTLTLPAANGTSSQVLRLADGNGNLEFADVSAAGNTSKQVLIIGATISAGSVLNTNTGTSNVTYAGDAINDLSVAGTQGKVLDVFVNGQLLVSGSSAQRTDGSRDYEVASTNELKFAFDLESDDIVQAVKRG